MSRHLGICIDPAKYLKYADIMHTHAVPQSTIHHLLALFLLVGLPACDEDPTQEQDPYRPTEGTVTLDLTKQADAEWFLANAKPFYRLAQGSAPDYVYSEWREGVGVCIAATDKVQSVSFDVVDAYFETAENKYGTDQPLAPHPEASDACDVCVGLSIPYFTPKRLRMTTSVINIDEDNKAELFVETPSKQDSLRLANPGSRGFIGLLTRVDAQMDGDNIVSNVTETSENEYIYLRPANGDATPGPFDSGNPRTVVQYGATLFDWFVLRAQAYEVRENDNGDPIQVPVFEANTETFFGDTAVSSLGQETNTMELFFDDSDSQRFVVNGNEVVSNVTGMPFDRTLLGSRTPNNSPDTMNLFFVGPGGYGCIQEIEMDF